MPKDLIERKKEFEKRFVKNIPVVDGKLKYSYWTVVADPTDLWSFIKQAITEAKREEMERTVRLCKGLKLDEDGLKLSKRLGADMNIGLDNIINILENELGYEVDLKQKDKEAKEKK